MSRLAARMIRDVDKSNGNAGCSTSITAQWGTLFIVILPLFLTGTSGSQYPPMIVGVFFMIQFIMSFILLNIMPEKEGMLDSSYLFILSYPTLFNLLYLNAF